MNKLSKTQLAGLSCMIFAIFFGAGNMIFPPAMAQQAGSDTLIALAGFIISDVGIAVAGVMAVVIAGTSMLELASKISKKFAVFLSFVVYLCNGPLFAFPRCVSVSFEIGLLPYIHGSEMLYSLIFTGIFFGLTFLLSVRPSKIVDIVGKVLTPLLLLCILAMFIACVLSPLGSMGLPSGDYQSIPFFKGIIEGYLALDGFAGLVFAILVVQALKGFGISEHKDVVKYSLICSLCAAVLLILVYGALALVGIQTSSMELFANGGNLLSYASRALFGELGGLILGCAVVLACLTTSIGLSTSFADFICAMYPRLNYKHILGVVCLFSLVVSNVGLNMLLLIVQPLLIVLYPIVVILVVVSLGQRWVKDPRAVMIGGMLCAFPFALLDGLKNAGLLSARLIEGMANLPLFNLGLGWLLPAVIGCILGMLFHRKGRSEVVG